MPAPTLLPNHPPNHPLDPNGLHPLDAAGGGPLGMSLGASGGATPMSYGGSSYSYGPYGPYGPTGMFGSTAPKPTPYGDFSWSAPTSLSAAGQFRANEGEKAIQRSAAARGTLLNGGTLKALEGYRQGLASEEAQNDFNRALSIYGTNRDTNAQNFGEAHTSFGDSLAGFNAGSGNALDWARFNASQRPMGESSGGLGMYGSSPFQPYGSTASVFGGSASTNARSPKGATPLYRYR